MTTKIHPTQTKTGRAVIAAHIGEYYTNSELIADTRAAAHPGDTLYQAAGRLVDGGCFLIYTEQQRDWLRKLYRQDPKTAEKFSDIQVFERYKHIIAQEIARIINAEKKGE